MRSTIIRNVKTVNEGEIKELDVLIKKGKIERIDSLMDVQADHEIDAQGLYLIPGIIDDQVHFREPGLTHKADIYSESRAAVVGGVTSFMEMPNTKPPAITQELLQDKYDIAAGSSWANYSFYMGASNDNIEEVLKTDPSNICGIKAFMGSSTGNMLVDDPGTLEQLFSRCPMLIATHCEDEKTIQNNKQLFIDKFGDKLLPIHHPQIRSDEGCYISSSFAVDLAKKHGTRLHILHISTEKELDLFVNNVDDKDKHITSEVCVHHLFFDETHYQHKGNDIVCNPAIKKRTDRDALREALLDGRLDVIATDHAPHTSEEKSLPYIQAPSGLPLVQHSLHVMLQFVEEGWITLEQIVDKMCHAPKRLFQLEKRGYIREGYWADLVLVDPYADYVVDAEPVWYKAGWTPFSGHRLKGQVIGTWVSGNLKYMGGKILGDPAGQRLLFDRK
jgi:dihydroorotase